MTLGTPVVYDTEGRPVMPRWAKEASVGKEAIQPEIELHGLHEATLDSVTSCICTSGRFFHLRYAFFDEEPEEDDGKTMCGRKRTKDKPGFWFKDFTSCKDCLFEAKVLDSDLGHYDDTATR